MSIRLPSSLAPAALCAIAAICAASCDDDPARPATPDAIPADVLDRTSVEALLTKALPLAYARRDSAAFAALLDESFQFELVIAQDTVRLHVTPREYWLMVASLVAPDAFAHSSTITHSQMDVRVGSIADASADGCAGCIEAQTTLSLRLTSKQEDVDEPLIFAADAPQWFVVKPDPRSAGSFVIVRQRHAHRT